MIRAAEKDLVHQSEEILSIRVTSDVSSLCSGSGTASRIKLATTTILCLKRQPPIINIQHVRAKSSPLQIGEIPVEETFPKEYESAGLGHGVVNRSQSAGLLSYKSKDHVGENEPNIGSILALREIALSRRHGLGPALEKK